MLCQTNVGGSNQATCLIIAAITMHVILNIEMGLELTDEQIAIAIPCQTTLTNWEYKLAAESYLKLAKELKGKPYALSQDGANKLGVDHLVKTITFLHNGKLKHVALDANGTGKDSVDIAHALIASLEKLEVYAKGSKCIAITGDAGGSGAVQTQFQILVDLEFFDDFCHFIRCTLHGQNNCLQNSIVA